MVKIRKYILYIYMLIIIILYICFAIFKYDCRLRSLKGWRARGCVILIFYSRVSVSFNSCNYNAARSVHCLLSKTDIFAGKVAER